MIPWGEQRDPCAANARGHYCKRVDREWICVYCGECIKTYDGPSLLDEALTMTEE